jgi:membrane protein DedA with SNARE-associated domain
MSDSNVPSRHNSSLRSKAPQIIVVTVVVVTALFVLLNTLEDVLIEGSSFTGTQLGMFLNALVSFAGNITVIVQSWGYVGLFIFMILESSSLPIPSEVILPFAGYLVSQGLLNFWLVIIVSTLAGILGSLIDYYIGLKGTSFLAKRKTIQKLLYDQGRMETAERWFRKHGASMVFVSRLIPLFRALISFPTGAVKMPLSRFIAYTTAGCLIWNTVLISVGVYVGANWREVTGVVNYLIIIVAIVTILIVALWLVRRKSKTQARKP